MFLVQVGRKEEGKERRNVGFEGFKKIKVWNFGMEYLYGNLSCDVWK